VPERSGAYMLERADVRVKRGSTWMTSAPLSFALSTHLNEIGWFSAALLP
jgi:hypothetical protein